MTNKRILHLFLLLSLPLIVVAQQFQPRSSDRSESRWSFSLNGGYEKNRMELKSATLTSEMNGIIESEIELLDEEGIAVSNSLFKNYQRGGYFSGGIEFRIWNGLSVFSNLGAIKLSEYSSMKEEKDLNITMTNDNLSFRYSVGLKYQWDITRNWFLIVAPQFTQTLKSSSKLEFNEDIDNRDLKNMQTSNSMIGWNIPLIGGYRIGKFSPYLGIQYRDFRYKNEFTYETVYVGEEAINSELRKYNSVNNVEGIAGVNFQITPKLSLNINTTISNSWKLQGGVSYNL